MVLTQIRREPLPPVSSTAPTSTDSPRVADPTDHGGPVPETATSESAEPPNTEQAAADTEVEASAIASGRRDNRAYFRCAAERLEQEVRSIPDSTRKNNGSSELHTRGSRASAMRRSVRRYVCLMLTRRASERGQSDPRYVSMRNHKPFQSLSAVPRHRPSGIVKLVTSVLRMIVSPFLTHGPFSPMESPIQWALMAFARGDVGRLKVDRALPAPVQVVFNPLARDKTLSPFPSNIFTVGDAGQNTGLRVDLPLPDPAARPSDYADISVINTLDGFNITPRISIPFNGEIDLSTVNSNTVFLQKLGTTVSGDEGPGAKKVGINQIVWDVATTTLHVTANDVLDEHTRYVLVVTSGVKDKNGNAIGSEEFEDFRHDLNSGQSNDPRVKEYRKELLDALKAVHLSGTKTQDIVVASVFTTRSVTTELEKIREQIYAAPQPTAFDLQTFQLDSLTDISVRDPNDARRRLLARPSSYIDLLEEHSGCNRDRRIRQVRVTRLPQRPERDSGDRDQDGRASSAKFERDHLRFLPAFGQPAPGRMARRHRRPRRDLPQAERSPGHDGGSSGRAGDRHHRHQCSWEWWRSPQHPDRHAQRRHHGHHPVRRTWEGHERRWHLRPG